jgi:hypothetical protein
VLLVNAVTTVTFAQQQQDDDDDVDTAVASLLEKFQEQHNAVVDPSLALPEIETIFFSSSSQQQSSPSPTLAAASSSIPTVSTEAVNDSTVTSAIVADPLLVPPTSRNICADPNEIEVSIYITPDAYPSEISWTLTNLCDSISTSGGPYSTNDGRLPQVFTQCIPNDTYEFSIYDSSADGICCTYGNGRYSIGVNGVEVHSGDGKYGSSDTVIIGSGCANTEDEEVREEMPTLSPTAATTTATATAPTTSATSSLSSTEETSSSTPAPVDKQQ